MRNCSLLFAAALSFTAASASAQEEISESAIRIDPADLVFNPVSISKRYYLWQEFGQSLDPETDLEVELNCLVAFGPDASEEERPPAFLRECRATDSLGATHHYYQQLSRYWSEYLRRSQWAMLSYGIWSRLGIGEGDRVIIPLAREESYLNPRVDLSSGDLVQARTIPRLSSYFVGHFAEADREFYGEISIACQIQADQSTICELVGAKPRPPSHGLSRISRRIPHIAKRMHIPATLLDGSISAGKRFELTIKFEID